MQHVPLRGKTCHSEESVDDVLLTHQDGGEEVADDHRPNLAGVRSLDAVPDEDAEVREKDDTK